MEDIAVSPGEALQPPAGQLTYAAVLFADVCGSTELSQRLGEERMQQVLKAFERVAIEVVARHGGSVARIQYDGLLALFGHPGSREDAARRATEAALDLRDESASRIKLPAGFPAGGLRVHSGLDFGLILIAEGGILRGQFDVIGLPAIAAARLCSLAGPGEICVNEQALGRKMRRFFDYSLVRDVSLKGLYSNVDVLNVRGRLDDDETYLTDEDTALPFVGRQHALRELARAAELARTTSRPVPVMIVGEPGIGKSRLIAEFRRRLDTSALVLQGSCEQHLGAAPLQPFMQGIRLAFGRNEAGPAPVSAESSATTAGHLARVRDLLGEQVPKARPAELVAAIIDVAALLSTQQMLVLILDDWQWADDASRETLRLILERPLGALVILGTRPEGALDNPVPDALTVQLRGLDVDESKDAVGAYSPRADQFLADEIFRKSGGNPLFIEELCHAAARNELAVLRGATGPARLNGLVISRVAQLPAPDAEVLRAASVLGVNFPAWVLQRLTGAANVEDVLGRLEAADFILPAEQRGHYRFKHVLTRDAVYTTVTDQPRVRLHLRAAQILEGSAGDGPPFEWLEALAFHYAGARDFVNAARYARSAGDKALGASALDRARAQYVAALQALDALPETTAQTRRDWCAIARKLGETCVFDPLELEDGLRYFERALQTARELADAEAIGHAEYWLAYMCYALGRPREAVQHSHKALEFAIQAKDERLENQMLATLGQSQASAGMYGSALENMEEALRRKRAHVKVGSSLALGSAYTLARKGYTLADIGRFAESEEAFEESFRLLGDRVHTVAASILEVKCVAHLWQGRWSDAQEAGDKGREAALRGRSRWMAAMGLALGACGRWAATQEPAALQQMREGTAWIEERGGAVSTSNNYGWLVEACVASGLAADARRYAARLFARSRLQDRQGLAMGCRAMARLSAATGDWTAAERYMRWAEEAAAFRSSVREAAMNDLARAEMYLGAQPANALRHAETAAAAFSAMNMRWHLQRAECLLRET